MKVDRTLQLRYFRRLWKENKDSKERYFWALKYAKVRYSIACAYRKTKKKKKRNQSQAPCYLYKQSDMLRLWQLAHSELESLCAEINKKFTLFELATSQNFEQASVLQNAPANAKLRVPADGSKAGAWSSVDQPHGWHELTSAPYKDSEEDVSDEDTDGEEDDQLSWREFNKKISLFEEKMKAKEAEKRAAFQSSLPQPSQP